MKKSAKIILGVVIAIFCLLLAGGGAFAYMIYNSPERILIAAVNTLSQELEQAEKTQPEKPDIDTLIQIYTSGSFAAEYDITTQNSFFDRDTTLKGSCEYDLANRKLRSDNVVTMSNSLDTMKMEYYIDQEKMYVLYPDLLEGSFIMPLDEYVEDTDSLFVEPSTELADTAGLLEGLEEKAVGNSIGLVESASVEKLKDQQGTYRVTIPKDKANEALDMEWKMQSDYVMDIKVEDNKYVTEISNAQTPLQVDEFGNISMTMSFHRTDGALTAVEILVDADDISMDYIFQYADANMDMKVECDVDGVKQKVSYWGTVTGNQDEIKMDMGGFRVYADDELVTSMSGLMTLKPLEGPVKKPKTEPEYDLLNMTEEEYMELFTQLGNKIYELF